MKIIAEFRKETYKIIGFYPASGQVIMQDKEGNECICFKKKH